MSWSFYPPISRSFECVASKDNIKYTLKIKFSYYAPKHEKKFNKLQPKTINEFSGYPPNIPPNSIKPSLKHIHPFSKKKKIIRNLTGQSENDTWTNESTRRSHKTWRSIYVPQSTIGRRWAFGNPTCKSWLKTALYSNFSQGHMVPSQVVPAILHQNLTQRCPPPKVYK